MDQQQLSELIFAIGHGRDASYADVASLVLLTFDYLLTLSLEIKYVWFSRWSIIKVLYFVMRYVPFFTMACVVLLDIPGRSPEACKKLMETCCYGVLIAVFAAEAILTLRIWAIYLRNCKMAVLLLVVYFGMTISLFVVLPQLLTSVKFVGLPFVNGPTCFLVAADKRFVIFWFMLAAYDAFQCALLASKAFGAFKHGGSSRLISLVYREGILYYLCIMAMSVVCMILALTSPLVYLHLTTEPTHIIHTSLTARVVLHTRQVTEQCEDASDITIENHLPTSKIIFAHGLKEM
ncbi:hypothetical protein AMATHDRAFT_67702 [Amanita thiersii Skay4041]|uniref:DUF6533 domain-containing protein n=1 Tax=Amanita thiersii Skay4041 TaxID=703135 RepID=A0A2A9NIG8_9AGAR|nr:hypothetical protein AMATHDRAFT_67702 [Amanita thiersii Skay4041]